MIAVPSDTRDFVDARTLQDRLFAELSSMFAREVPLYGHSLEVNATCNRTACDILQSKFVGLQITDEDIELTSAERHGAIRIGTPEEYMWVARFFACFDMHPHNFYDMTSVGAKSQPVIATAFRSTHNPKHRVFTSLLRTEFFDFATREILDSLLDGRSIMTTSAKELIEQCEREGGLGESDAQALIHEATNEIFKWKGTGSEPQLYDELCEAGYKIAADIACFHSHHLNHLTPNTICMDLYTAAMRFVLSETNSSEFEAQAIQALTSMLSWMDLPLLKLHFSSTLSQSINNLSEREVPQSTIAELVHELRMVLEYDRNRVTALDHQGFKDRTEGPPADRPILLRQDAYRALREDVRFTDSDGNESMRFHTARFGEIEQRFYATTSKGRALYDSCLNELELLVSQQPGLPASDPDAYHQLVAKTFDPVPMNLYELHAQGLVYVRYEIAADYQGTVRRELPTDPIKLVQLGILTIDGQRYEDFLPASAAGIFSSNLDQHGLRTTSSLLDQALKAELEGCLPSHIIESDSVYKQIEIQSLRSCLQELGFAETIVPA